MQKGTRLILITVLSVVAVFAAYSIYNWMKPEGEAQKLPGQEENAQDQDQEAQMAPGFTLKELSSGNNVSLSDYRGKIVVLNFWTTWCGYCKEEMPDLERVAQGFAKGEDAVLLTVNVQEEDKLAADYLVESKLELPVLMDYDGSVAANYGVGGYPSTYFINRDGTAAYVIPYQTDEKTILETVNTMK